jgi:hypothetical protein
VWKYLATKETGQYLTTKEQKTEYMCEYPSKNAGRKIIKALANI